MADIFIERLEASFHAARRVDRRVCAGNECLPGLEPLENLTPALEIELTDQTYLPKLGDPRSDWIASVAIPAMLAYRNAVPTKSVESFCTIGTGAGIDGLAAVEIFRPDRLYLTDLHPVVTDCALGNVRRNIRPGLVLDVSAGAGDLAEPLGQAGVSFDLIYENLPNIPLPEGLGIDLGRTSSSFHERRHGVPDEVESNLLSLHYQFLRDVEPYLTGCGAVLSSIGARRPISAIIGMARAAGFETRPLIFTWKIQSELDEVVPGYARQEERTGQSFTFYPIDVLEEHFANLTPTEAAARALDIEDALRPFAITSREALKYDGAIPLGHSVVVLESRLC